MSTVARGTVTRDVGPVSVTALLILLLLLFSSNNDLVAASHPAGQSVPTVSVERSSRALPAGIRTASLPAELDRPASAAPASPAWTPVELANNDSGPGGLTGAMAWDAADGYEVLFDETGTTWTYRAGTWTSLVTSTAPSPRQETAMAFDAADGYVLLFGGESGSVVLGDTWKFSHGTWTNLTPTLKATPPPATDAGMTYDAADGYIVMYGGFQTYSSPWTTTWTYRGGTWTPLPPSKVIPSPNADVELTYDVSDGYVVFFGFWNDSAGRQSTTWTFRNGTWSSLNLTYAPTPRQDVDLAYVSSLRAVVMVYGRPTDSLGRSDLNETWTYSSGAWKNLTDPALGAFPSTLPGMEGPLADDPVDGFAVLTDPGCRGAATYCGETYGFPAWPVQVVVTAGHGVLAVNAPPRLGGSQSGGVFGSGATGWFFEGWTLPLSAQPAPGWALGQITATGAASLGAGGVTVGGSASLEVAFSPYPIVQFLVRPGSCGPITFDGTLEASNGYDMNPWVPGAYTAGIRACQAHIFAGWSGASGVSVSPIASSPTTVTVSANGTLLAIFEDYPLVTLVVVPASCGPVTFNGSPFDSQPPYSPSPSVAVPIGTYPATVSLCAGRNFLGWSVSGGLVLESVNGLNATVSVSGNGTLSASFSALPPPPITGPPTWPFILLLVVGVVTLLLLAAATVLLRRRRSQMVKGPPPKPEDPPFEGPAEVPPPSPEVQLW